MTRAWNLEPLFEGFFLGGFECSCSRLEDGRRLDMAASTGHDQLVWADYGRLRSVGMTACRDGVSWVDSERLPGEYDFSRVAPMVAAARAHKIQVIWDLMHFGWPDDVDVFSFTFPARFGRYARAFARWYAGETDQRAMITPITEMSFLSWAGGDLRVMNPFEAARGVELKVQLVRATLEAIDAIRAELPSARFVQPESVTHVVPDPRHPRTWRRVESDELSQYQAWDMLSGRVWPALGGSPEALDIIGVDFYPDNQFTLDGSTVNRGDPRYKPFALMLQDVWARYERPMLVSATGSEGAGRAAWLAYVADQCAAALREGCPLHGVTLYPVVDLRGWEDDRDCQNGLWGPADAEGRRAPCAPALEELGRQTGRLLAERAQMLARWAGGSSKAAVGA